MAVLVNAVVRKLLTEDGLLQVAPGHHVGETCVIDLATKVEVGVFSLVTNVTYQKTLVQDAFDGGWWPWDCLEVLS